MIKNITKLKRNSAHKFASSRRKALFFASILASLSNGAFAQNEIVMAPIIALLDGPNLCVDEAVEPILQPVDLIFVVDNSLSMSAEANALESVINSDLYLPLQAAGIDSRVLMVTDHGSAASEVCVPQPLSGTTDCDSAPIAVADQFYHYDINIQSHDAWCLLLDTMNDGPDEWNTYPDGWTNSLRADALKVVIPMTDDGVSCTTSDTLTTLNDGNTVPSGQAAAVAWDNKLLALSPSQFGTPASRNYVMHSFLGIAEKAPPEPYGPFEAVTTAKCASAVDPGTGYQWISKGTNGLRFPICNTSNYASHMSAIVDDTLGKTTNNCQYSLPDPSGQVIAPLRISLIYSPTIGSPVTFNPVADMMTCGTSTSGFYITGNTMNLCPDTCTLVTDDAADTIQVKAFCL